MYEDSCQITLRHPSSRLNISGTSTNPPILCFPDPPVFQTPCCLSYIPLPMLHLDSESARILQRSRTKIIYRFFKGICVCDCQYWQSKPIGQALAGWKLAGVDAVVLRQNFFFSEDLFLLLRPLLDSVNTTDPCDR